MAPFVLLHTRFAAETACFSGVFRTHGLRFEMVKLRIGHSRDCDILLAHFKTKIDIMERHATIVLLQAANSLLIVDLRTTRHVGVTANGSG
jgi:hypothetical protein